MINSLPIGFPGLGLELDFKNYFTVFGYAIYWYAVIICVGLLIAYLYADRITRRSVAGRGIGELPLMQKSKIVKLLAPFQVEVSNQWEVMKDKAKTKDLTNLIIELFAEKVVVNT